MFRIALAVLVSISTLNAYADLPSWVNSAAKNAAYDQHVEWMKAGETLYKITNAEVSQIVLPSGQDAADVEIAFDDSAGCKGRKTFAQCTPLGDVALGCFIGMTDCLPSSHRQIYLKIAR
jgi:hypothetical protein